MTVRKHFKERIRDRMSKTGESYTSARRHLLSILASKPIDPRTKWHFPGSIPATTALRVILAAAGVTNPKTGKPFSEAMLFGVAGGIGIGVAQFHYAKENFSSFFVAGRHQWYDDLVYLKAALDRFGIKPVVKESGGAKAAEKQLHETLEQGPCIAWVDMAHLPHRALPSIFSGGGYHVITIYKIENDMAVIGDLTDEPIEISLKDLADARSRIVKQKHRILSIPAAKSPNDLGTLVKNGLAVCHRAITAKSGKGPLAMSTLDSLKKWADRLHGSKDKESWEKTFPPGVNLWRGLTSIHLFIEMYGTGGGLCRPMMAEFLTEAGETLNDARLSSLAEQFTTIGKQWSILAHGALPDSNPILREARSLHNQYAELCMTSGDLEEKRQVWASLDELSKQAADKFPLDDQACADLRVQLQTQVRHLIASEQTALENMKALIG